MNRLIVCLILLATLVGCASKPPRERVRTVEVKVPVKVACIDKKPEAPAYRFGVGPYPGDSEAVGVLAADLEAAKLYGRRWEAAATGCEIPPRS